MVSRVTPLINSSSPAGSRDVQAALFVFRYKVGLTDTNGYSMYRVQQADLLLFDWLTRIFQIVSVTYLKQIPQKLGQRNWFIEVFTDHAHRKRQHGRTIQQES